MTALAVIDLGNPSAHLATAPGTVEAHSGHRRGTLQARFQPPSYAPRSITIHARSNTYARHPRPATRTSFPPSLPHGPPQFLKCAGNHRYAHAPKSTVFPRKVPPPTTTYARSKSTSPSAINLYALLSRPKLLLFVTYFGQRPPHCPQTGGGI